jgi:methionine synthase I (cobalamin-dependent)
VAPRDNRKPDEKIHRDYFEAGVDAVETKYVRLQSG